MKYKVGDRVRIKSIDWYNENKDANGDVLCFYDVHKFTKEMSKFCNKTVTISTNLTGDGEYLIKEDDETNWWTDDMIECKVEERFENHKCPKVSGVCQECVFAVKDDNPHCGLRGFRNDFNVKSCSAKNDTIPNGFELQSDGYFSWINKKEYPKTYEECCKVMNYCCNPVATKTTHKEELIRRFHFLLLYRDAYWKIAGDEMGLGKPWEPDYDSGVNKYGIICMNGVAQKSNPTTNWERHLNKILDFPTEEMRDAFKENFKELIENCKELL